jgi:hypothetical protein
MGVVYLPVVRWPDGCFIAVSYYPLDDENMKMPAAWRFAGGILNPWEVMTSDEYFERGFDQNR